MQQEGPRSADCPVWPIRLPGGLSRIKEWREMVPASGTSTDVQVDTAAIYERGVVSQKIGRLGVTSLVTSPSVFGYVL